MISLIVARNRKGFIGLDNKLPWKTVKEDMKFFKEFTMDKVVIMGSNTFESIGKPLKGRTNVILTTNQEKASYFKKVLMSYEEECHVIVADRSLSTTRLIHRIRTTVGWNQSLVIIGGGVIYEKFLPYVGRVLLSEIQSDENGDTKFNFDVSNFMLRDIVLKTDEVVIKDYLRIVENPNKNRGKSRTKKNAWVYPHLKP